MSAKNYNVGIMSTETALQGNDTFFLPDLCEIRMVFAVVVIGELFAFILVLAPISRGDFWYELGIVSLFVQWVGLTSAALLCLLRNHLARLSNTLAGVVSIILILVVTVLLSEAAFMLIKQGYIAITSPDLWHWEFIGRNMAISGIISVLALRYFYIQFQWKRNLELETRARIQALQSRIRPHFLFNSMNTIASLTRTRPAVAEQVVVDLAELLRSSLGDAQVPATLEREVDICRRYINIEELRLGERFRVQWELQDFPKDAILPALTLQPLLENAIYHGIETSVSGGTISVEILADNGHIVIEIRNPLPPGVVDNPRRGNQMAQKNVRERLHAFFGPGSGFQAQVDGGEYLVILRFPYRHENPDS